MKVSIFIDGKNFYSGWKTKAGGQRLDYSRLTEWLLSRVKGSVLTACHYYTGVEPDGAARTEGQLSLVRYLDALEMLPGYFVHRFARREASHRCSACGGETRFTQEKEVDTTMVADMLRLAAVDAFDTMVLVSGDADHLPAIRGVRTLGKIAYVSSWGGSGMSNQLRKNAFDHIDLIDGLTEFSSTQPEARAATAPVATMTDAPERGEAGDPDLDAVVLAQIALAYQHFARNPGGFLGINYFATKWHHEGFNASSHERRRAIDRLERDGMVEKYRIEGQSALRLTDEGRRGFRRSPLEPAQGAPGTAPIPTGTGSGTTARTSGSPPTE